MPTVQQNLAIHRYKCQSDADYSGKTIQRLEVRIAQDMPVSIRRHMLLTSGQSQTHTLAIGEYL